MSKTNWTYYFARKFSASRFEVVMRVFFSRFYQQHFKIILKNNLIRPYGKNHAIYYQRPEWDKFANRVYQTVCRNFNTFSYYVRLIKQSQHRSLKIAREIIAQPLKRLSWSELGRLWRRWDQAHLSHFLKPIWIPFIIEPLLSQEAAKILDAKVIPRPSPDTTKKIFDIVFSPDQPNAITREHQNLVEIALKIKNGKLTGEKFKAALLEHTNKYGFIPCYDVIDYPWDVQYFRQELSKLLSSSESQLKQELKTLKARFSQTKKEFHELLKILKINRYERELLKMAHQITFIKDERDDYRRLQCYTIQPLFQEIARRYHIPFRAPLYLIKEEMEEWFKTGKLPASKSELEERMRGYCLVRLNSGSVKILSGQAMNDFLKRQSFEDEVVESQKETVIKGLIGNKGVGRGSVAIVMTKHDLRKVNRGDILVAVTTNPDYVPALRLARAIITDEGGITSHAAIVARELNVPCIIGTKIATKLLKDGQLVEVDANKGVIRKLSK